MCFLAIPVLLLSSPPQQKIFVIPQGHWMADPVLSPS